MPFYNTNLVKTLLKHQDCDLRIATYGNSDALDSDSREAVNATVECADHGEVIVDAEPANRLPSSFEGASERTPVSLSPESYGDELPSENVIVTARVPMNLLVEEDQTLEEALKTEISERMTSERRRAFFEDASFSVASPDAELPDPDEAAEIDPLGYYVCSDGVAYGPYSSEDRAYRRAARWSDEEDKRYVVERGAILTDYCVSTSLTVKEPGAEREKTARGDE